MNREKENNRELSSAEKKRSIRFEKTKKELCEKGYEVQDLTIGIVYANVMAVVLTLPIIFCLAALYYFCNQDFFERMESVPAEKVLVTLILFWVLLLVLIVVHELIHGITWSLFAKKRWKSISFGFIAQYMTPYCTCDEALRKGQYVAGALMPTIMLGIVPAVISIITGSIFLFGIGAFMLMSGGGDLTIVLKLMRFRTKGKEVLYLDHPYQAGLVAFVKEY